MMSFMIGCVCGTLRRGIHHGDIGREAGGRGGQLSECTSFPCPSSCNPPLLSSAAEGCSEEGTLAAAMGVLWSCCGFDASSEQQEEERFLKEVFRTIEENDFQGLQTIVLSTPRQLAENASDRKQTGYSPLHYTAVLGRTDMAAWLLDTQNAELDGLDLEQQTPLFLASLAGHTEFVEQLLRKGADPRIRSKQGVSPLMAAAWRGRLEILRQLLETVRPDEAECRAALALAEEWNQTEAVDLLQDAIRNPDVV